METTSSNRFATPAPWPLRSRTVALGLAAAALASATHDRYAITPAR